MTGDAVPRVGMWSGPRNISTAMMRAFENRRDTVVVDEPLYAAYPRTDRHRSPGTRAGDRLAADRPRRRHRGALGAASGRPPRPLRQAHGPPRRTRHGPQLDDRLSERAADPRPGRGRRLVRSLPGHLRARGHRAAAAGVADRAVGRARPRCPDPRRRRLPARPRSSSEEWLCDWLGIPFTERTLSWPPVPRDSDGVWAPHWYAAVWESTGFQPWRPRDTTELSEHDAGVAEACRPIYEALRARSKSIDAALG